MKPEPNKQIKDDTFLKVDKELEELGIKHSKIVKKNPRLIIEGYLRIRHSTGKSVSSVYCGKSDYNKNNIEKLFKTMREAMIEINKNKELKP